MLIVRAEGSTLQLKMLAGVGEGLLTESVIMKLGTAGHGEVADNIDWMGIIQ